MKKISSFGYPTCYVNAIHCMNINTRIFVIFSEVSNSLGGLGELREDKERERERVGEFGEAGKWGTEESINGGRIIFINIFNILFLYIVQN